MDKVFMSAYDEKSMPNEDISIDGLHFTYNKPFFLIGNKKLTGKMVGCVFGREQYEKENKELAFATKIVQIRSVEAIKAGVEPPEDKLLDAKQTSSGKSDSTAFGTEIVFDDDDVPF